MRQFSVRSHRITWLCLALGGLPALGAGGPDIRVREIDTRTGRGMPGMPVWLYLGDPMKASTPRLEATTDGGGTITFHLTSPVPDQIFIYDEVLGAFRACSHGTFRTEEIMRVGVVGADTCDRSGKLRKKFRAQPGEVILFVRKLRWWEGIQT